MVGVPKSGHHPPLHKVSTFGAFGAVEFVVVSTAVVVVFLHEIASRGQQSVAHCHACESVRFLKIRETENIHTHNA